MDNLECDILRIANPKIINSDNGNDSSMVFKMTATDVDKDIIFLGDIYVYGSEELVKLGKEKLSSYAVQMAHHGQNGATKEVYDLIRPTIAFFNAPEWLYDNDSGGGFNSGPWQSIIVRSWLDEYGTEQIICVIVRCNSCVITTNRISKRMLRFHKQTAIIIKADILHDFIH